MTKCMQGRGAIGTTLTYIDSQQPFPYVHLLALLTDMALAVNSATVGLQTGRQLSDPTTLRSELPLLGICTRAAAPTALPSFTCSDEGISPEGTDRASLRASLRAVAGAFVRVAAFVLIYNGLLAISVHLENPLGDDPADLPALAYQVWMRKECESFSAGIDAIELDRGWWEGLVKPGQKAAADAKKA